MSEQPHADNPIINKPTTTQGHARTDPELAELDARLKRLKDGIILETPFVLTVPTDRPFRLDPNRFHDWQRDTPFQHYEEQLQYLSFLPDWDGGLIKAVDGWLPYQLIRDREEVEETAFMERTLSQQSTKSGASGSGGAPKKIKYSLSDYKKKAAGQPTGGGARDDVSSSKINGTSNARRGSSSSRSSGRALKRPREDGEISEASENVPIKRRRSSGSRSATPPTRKLELPPDISPTLPAIFERELARLGKLDRLDSTAKHSDQAQTKHKSSDKDSKLLKADSADRRGDDSKPRAKVTDRSSPSVPNGTSTKVSKSHRDEGASHTSKSSLIVKLRLPKSIRKNVQRILALAPRSQKKSEGVSKGVARKIDRVSPHPDQSGDREKRRREDHSEGNDDGRSGTIKRAKHPNNLDLSKPSTPLASALRSPALGGHSTNQKPSVTSDPSGKTLTVPRDDGGASTPSGGHRNGTPTAPDSVERANRDGKPSSRQQRSAAYTELRQVERDMFTLGRASKHSSDRELNSESSPSPRRVKRGLAFGLECILAFMLSYTVRDEMNRLMPPTGENAATETWTTIFPYIQRIKKTAQSNDHKHIQGLCLQLEAVCHLAAWNNNVSRAMSSDQPSSSTGTAALMKHYNSSATLFADGHATLPVDALQHSFPHTWTTKAVAPLASHRASSSASSSNGASSGSAAKFDPHPIGDFALPITSITTGVEAVRAGRALLVEWCDRQKLDWTPSLGRRKKDDRERDRDRGREKERER